MDLLNHRIYGEDGLSDQPLHTWSIMGFILIVFISLLRYSMLTWGWEYKIPHALTVTPYDCEYRSERTKTWIAILTIECQYEIFPKNTPAPAIFDSKQHSSIRLHFFYWWKTLLITDIIVSTVLETRPFTLSRISETQENFPAEKLDHARMKSARQSERTLRVVIGPRRTAPDCTELTRWGKKKAGLSDLARQTDAPCRLSSSRSSRKTKRNCNKKLIKGSLPRPSAASSGKYLTGL